PKQNVTLKNTGTAALSVTGITITGANRLSFSETNTCGSSVAAGKSCVISIEFSPMKTGTLIADVNIADGASGSPQTVALTGTAAGPIASFSATSLSFTSTAVGVDSAKKSLTLTNTGNGKLGRSGGD